jgi:hypothetical protein
MLMVTDLARDRQDKKEKGVLGACISYSGAGAL